MRCTSRWLAAVIVIVAAAGVARGAEPPENVAFEADVTYATVAGEELKLNLARPKEAAAPLPCIVVIHGGAWREGNRAQLNALTWRLAQKGYVAATIGYRFCPKHPFPAQVQDVKAAVRFLRAGAGKYGIDPGRVGAVGFSAGAHLSMMLGTMDAEDGLDDSGGSEGYSSKVGAVVAYFGPTDLLAEFPPVSQGLLRDFIGGTPQEKAETYRRASPLTYLNSGDAPMLLFHGTSDLLVPHGQAISMAEAMQKAEVPGRVELLVGSGHGWGGPELQRTEAATLDFFDQQLKR